jgi:hypothetical protein
VDVLNAGDVGGLAAAVSDVLVGKGFKSGAIGNHEGGPVDSSQVFAAEADDPGAQDVARSLGGLPVTADASVPAGSVKVVLAMDYTGPGSGLEGSETQSATSDTGDSAGYVADESAATAESSPPPSPVLTAASSDPQCVN